MIPLETPKIMPPSVRPPLMEVVSGFATDFSLIWDDESAAEHAVAEQNSTDIEEPSTHTPTLDDLAEEGSKTPINSLIDDVVNPSLEDFKTPVLEATKNWGDKVHETSSLKILETKILSKPSTPKGTPIPLSPAALSGRSDVSTAPEIPVFNHEVRPSMVLSNDDRRQAIASTVPPHQSTQELVFNMRGTEDFVGKNEVVLMPQSRSDSPVTTPQNQQQNTILSMFSGLPEKGQLVSPPQVAVATISSSQISHEDATNEASKEAVQSLPNIPRNRTPIVESSAAVSKTNVERSFPMTLESTKISPQAASKLELNPAVPQVPSLNVPTTPLTQPKTASVPQSALQAPVSLSPPVALPVSMDFPMDGQVVQDVAVLPTGPSSVTEATRPLSVHAMQPHAPHIAQQIATATVRFMGATTEIALNPEELGRVRISLTAVETGVSVSIIAERPETTELMRRNIELLAREFRELGHGSVSFSFDGSHENSDGNSDQSPLSETVAEDSTPENTPHPLKTTVVLRSGLDLKL